MKVKPTEVRLVSGLLQQEHPDADTLAETIIQSLDDKRAKEDQWVVIYQWQPNEGQFVTLTYGPFNTRKRAEKCMDSLVSPGEPLAKAMICRMHQQVAGA